MMRRFGLLSLALHAVLLAALLVWMQRARPVGDDESRPTGTVELVLRQQKGAEEATSPNQPAPASPPPAAPEAPEAAAQPEPPHEAPPEPPHDAQPEPPPPPTETAEAAPPLPTPPVPPAAPPARPPAVAAASPPRQTVASTPAPRAREAPQISLRGNSDTDAIVTGPNVIPASVDAKFRNRTPVYPAEAARRGQQGSVLLLIHVSPQGLPAGIDIAESSGFALLDRAAREAVEQWRFLPAVENGQPVPFTMPFRILFQLE